MKKKRNFTLLEIMIVIFLIGLITSVVGYNLKGSLTQGKVFKTEQAIERIKDILEFELARGVESNAINDNYEKVLADSGLIKNTKNLTKDGWGNPFKVSVNENNEVIVESTILDTHLPKNETE